MTTVLPSNLMCSTFFRSLASGALLGAALLAWPPAAAGPHRSFLAPGVGPRGKHSPGSTAPLWLAGAPPGRSLVSRDEDVLGLGERVRGVRPELTAEAGLLEAAKRRPVPHRGMRVHRQVPALHRPGHPDRAAHV